MRRVIEIVFMLLFVLCGCSIDSICDSGSGIWLFVALVVLMLTASVLGGDDY